ncbi:MAG: hypothetical protein IJN88_02110 [Clostridia bacterium]|nr:hypothetical protein [Clostridia bacterium]
MKHHIDKLYNNFDNAKEHILTPEAFEKYDKLSKLWIKLTIDLPVEEKTGYICLRVFFEDFLNTCCKDHFSKGFESGLNVAYKLRDKILTPLEDDKQR